MIKNVKKGISFINPLLSKVENYLEYFSYEEFSGKTFLMFRQYTLSELSLELVCITFFSGKYVVL